MPTTVEVLPDGWLGKNHALWTGARSAPASDYLLFTDADVRFAPGAIAAAGAERLEEVASAIGSLDDNLAAGAAAGRDDATPLLPPGGS